QRHVDELSRLLLGGTPSEAAMNQVYGSVDKVEEGYLRVIKQGVFMYGRLSVDSDTSAQKYPVRSLSAAESAVHRASFHVAIGRLTEAHALLEEARKADATLARIHEDDGASFNREKKFDEERQAYAKAAELGSNNFYVYYRLAAMASRPNADAATLATIQKQL